MRTTPVRCDDAPHVDPREHVVLLYETEQALAQCVVSFLTPALVHDEAVLVVATPGRRRLLASALTAAGADVDELRRLGRYVEVDAVQALGALVQDGRVSRLGFDTAVGHCVRTLSALHGRVHVYGEMVACLWGRGDAAAALELEALWNEVAADHDFRLCCAYPSSLLEPGDPRVTTMLDTHTGSTRLGA